MKGKLFNIKLTDTNSIRCEWQYEMSPDEALENCNSIVVVDYYSKKKMYLPVRSILYITEDDTKKIGF